MQQLIMGKRQREWAYRKRLELIDLLGGVCDNCGSIKELEIDHMDGRDYNCEDTDQSVRVSKYFREYRSGVRLRVLCASCNKKLKPKVVNKKLDVELEPVF